MATNELSLLNTRGVVYYLEAGEWKQQGEGYSLISIYHETSRDMYRVVAISSKSREAVINSRIFKEQAIKKEGDNFYQWADGKLRYGVNIEKEKGAEFETKFKEVTEKLATQPTPPPVSGRGTTSNPLGSSAPAAVSSPVTTRVGTLQQRTPPPVSPRTASLSGSTPPPLSPSPSSRHVSIGRGAPPSTPSPAVPTTVQTGVTPGARGAPPQVKPFSRPGIPPKTPSRTNLLSSGGAISLPDSALDSTTTTGSVEQALPPTEAGTRSATNPPRLPSFRSNSNPPDPEPTPATPPSPSRFSIPTTIEPPSVSPRNGSLSRNTPSPLASPSTTTQAGRGTPIKPSAGTVGPSSGRRIPSVTLGHATVSYNQNRGSTTVPSTALESVDKSTDTNKNTGDESEEQEGRSRSMTDSYFMAQNSDRRDPVLKRLCHPDLSPINVASAQLIRILMQEAAGLFDKQTSQVPSEIMSLITFIEIYGLGVQDILAYQVLSKHLMAPLFKQLRTTKGAVLSPDTDPHLAAQMLKTAIADLPHPPINFEKYEPKQAFTEIQDLRGQVEYARGVVASLSPPDKETVGALVALLNKACHNSSTNGLTAERLAAIFAPFLVDTKWLNYRQSTSVKLNKPFQL
eukprot:TRINITY_DN3156_c1_g1_i1.p1 TRINITY_DN3156_c1_g1~~TRINITY_DN3156_c1_g1_i1.p1  ORF type:complete len:627 (-),score=73.39 TRINITY_DN3156_c1_g1_i1:59-1939(-)